MNRTSGRDGKRVEQRGGGSEETITKNYEKQNTRRRVKVIVKVLEKPNEEIREETEEQHAI